MRYYDLYGTRAMSSEELQQAVGDAVRLSFRRRYSDEIGTYYKAEVGEELFTVKPNFDEARYENEVLEPEFADYPVLLRVSLTERGDQIRDLLLDIPGLEHLRRDTRE